MLTIIGYIQQSVRRSSGTSIKADLTWNKGTIEVWGLLDKMPGFF